MIPSPRPQEWAGLLDPAAIGSFDGAAPDCHTARASSRCGATVLENCFNVLKVVL